MTRKTQGETRSIDRRMESLETGDLSVQEARALLRELIAKDKSEDTAVRTYEALRAWLGCSLRERNVSLRLREWHSLVEALAAQFDDNLPLWSARIEVLSDLMRDRIALDEARPAADVMRRQHVPELLALLAGASGQAIDRTEIMTALGLKQANLSRVIRIARDAGLIEREIRGKEAAFAASSLGLSLLSSLEYADDVQPSYEMMGDLWPAAHIIGVSDFADGDARIIEFGMASEEPEPLPLAA